MPFVWFLSFLYPLVFIVLIIAAVAATIGGRREPDHTGRRPYAIYLTAITFIALFTTLGAGFALIHSLAEIAFVNGDAASATTCPPGAVNCFGGSPYGEAQSSSGREALQTALITAVFAVVLYFHGRRLLDLRRDEPSPDTTGGRVLNVFAYALCFVLLFVGLGAATAALTSVVDSIDPASDFGDAQGRALATLVTTVLLAVASGFLFRFTWTTFALGPRQPEVPPPPH